MTLDEFSKLVIGKEVVGIMVDFESERITIEVEGFDIDISGAALELKLFQVNPAYLN